MFAPSTHCLVVSAHKNKVETLNPMATPRSHLTLACEQRHSSCCCPKTLPKSGGRELRHGGCLLPSMSAWVILLEICFEWFRDNSSESTPQMTKTTNLFTFNQNEETGDDTILSECLWHQKSNGLQMTPKTRSRPRKPQLKPFWIPLLSITSVSQVCGPGPASAHSAPQSYRKL